MSETDFQSILTSPTETYDEGLRFFMGTGVLNKTLRRIASDLEDRGIEYAVIGAIALNQHGYRRFTEDIDLLLTGDGLRKFHDELIGLGYSPAFQGATQKFRATEENVTVEIVTSKDLDADFADKLDASVRDKFLELQQAVALACKHDLGAGQTQTPERDAERETE